MICDLLLVGVDSINIYMDYNEDAIIPNVKKKK